MKRKVMLTCTFLLLIPQFSICQVKDYDKYQDSYPKPLDNGITQAISVHIIYDNYVHTNGMESDWGYSILIKGLDKTILFDTGTKPKIFESNFKKLGVDAKEIDEVFISHNHGDHTGGLGKILSMNPDIKVLVPGTFGKDIYFVFGGFHLMRHSVNEISEIIENTI
jgi:metal-dependent hydrolase (beta-lactamase superfamily II)